MQTSNDAKLTLVAENTRASFLEACKAGADGIETGGSACLPLCTYDADVLDIHMTSDDCLVLFHDPELGRTTTGTGRIDHLPWHGVLEWVLMRLMGDS